MVSHSTEAKNRSAFLGEPNLAWFARRELSILDRLQSGPRSCCAVDWVTQGGSVGAAPGHLVLLLSSPSPSLRTFTREAPRPDQMGICHKMLLEH